MNIALIRTMDSQGRIVIPAEIRKQMKLSDGDALELENVGMELLLRKCPTHLNRKEEMASYLSVLYSVIHCGIAICSSLTSFADSNAALQFSKICVLLEISSEMDLRLL